MQNCMLNCKSFKLRTEAATSGVLEKNVFFQNSCSTELAESVFKWRSSVIVKLQHSSFNKKL